MIIGVQRLLSHTLSYREPDPLALLRLKVNTTSWCQHFYHSNATVQVKILTKDYKIQNYIKISMAFK